LLKRTIIATLAILAIVVPYIVSLFLRVPISIAEDTLPIIVDFNGEIRNNGLPSPWLLRVNKGQAHVKVLHQRDEDVLYLRCDSSSFSLERGVSASPEEYPYVTWTWKAMRLPAFGDVRKKERNDQGLQILFAFENRKIISYVWDANAPEGTITDESFGWPLNLSIKVIVVNSGTDRLGEWVSNTRDVYLDYRNLYHEDPPRIKGLRIQANTQYTRGCSEGIIRDVIFSSKNTGQASRAPYGSTSPHSMIIDQEKQRRENHAKNFCARHECPGPRPKRTGEIRG
jgi:hypothetical protein